MRSFYDYLNFMYTIVHTGFATIIAREWVAEQYGDGFDDYLSSPKNITVFIIYKHQQTKKTTGNFNNGNYS